MIKLILTLGYNSLTLNNFENKLFNSILFFIPSMSSNPNINVLFAVSSFLKHLFAESLKEVEIDTIKSHLKDDERKGIIKITDSLSDFN